MPKFTDEMIRNLLDKLVGFGLDIVIALIILFVGRKLIKLIIKIIGKLFDKVHLDVGVKKFLMSFANLALYAVLIVMIAKQVGIDTASIIALLASAGLAVGLALQGSLSNFAGGVLILLLRPFHAGDYIIDKGTGLEGVVQSIDLFYTRLTTPDNKVICIPNGSLSNSGITNISTNKKRRLDLNVGIGYTSDIKLAKQLIRDILEKRENVIKEDGITIFVNELGESAIDIGFRCYVDGSNYWTEKWEILEAVKYAFDEAGVEIPFNQLDVHIEEGRIERKSF